MMSHPLLDLSLSKQNTRLSPTKLEFLKHSYNTSTPCDAYPSTAIMSSTGSATPLTPEEDEFHDAETSARRPSFTVDGQPRSIGRSPRKPLALSPPGSPTESTMRFNEGLTRTISDIQGKEMQEKELQEKEMEEASHVSNDDTMLHHTIQDESMSKIETGGKNEDPTSSATGDETDITISLDDRSVNEETIGDLSTISAIPTDMTRFAALRSSPTKAQSAAEPWSPSKQRRTSVVLNTPSTGARQRPLHLLSRSRHSNSSNEDDDATPRRRTNSNDSPADLLNFTGQSNVLIPPPGSAPRTRRSPSGRGGFPIRVNPSPNHRSQASLDRERSAGARSPDKRHSYFPPQPVPATPVEARMGMFAQNGTGIDLLDIDLEPMATPRSIPSVTPRELETLRSELQSRISGLEATLSGKEAEVMALKRAITDAEVRVGKTSEDLRNERAAKADLEQAKLELERRSREMENVLREVKQNAFVEEREREKLRQDKEEVERRVEEHQVKILELNASLETLTSQRINANATPSPEKAPSAAEHKPATPNGMVDVDTAVKNATESVARELHALYKGKHERKVADLKQSYEKRWIKQVEQLRSDLKASQDEVQRLQTERDATMSALVPGQAAKMADLVKENEELAAEKGVLGAKVAGLEEQVVSFKNEVDALRKEVEQERVEKGELVAQVDLFLSISAQQEQASCVALPESPPRSDEGGVSVSVSANSNTSTTASASAATTGPRGSPSKAASPNKSRTSVNGTPIAYAGGVGGGGTGVAALTGMNGAHPPSARSRPMSMLKAPMGGKYSGIPGPGESRLKAPGGGRPISMMAPVGGGVGGGSRGGILEGIARMGAGGRG